MVGIVTGRRTLGVRLIVNLNSEFGVNHAISLPSSRKALINFNYNVDYFDKFSQHPERFPV